MSEYKFKAGETVEIVEDNDVWDGTIATIKSVGVDPEFPYELVVVHPGPGNRYRVAGENVGGWPERNLKRFRDRTPQEEAIDKYFPRRLDTLWSDASGNAVVHTVQNKFVRVLKDGTVDLTDAELEKLPL